ncbi:hypothetical protein C8J56DRAFT_450934 [Mycena floridula]|nr:hypothetical protein C8J56DRAFT_450934 [Mycena floridula]
MAFVLGGENTDPQEVILYRVDDTLADFITYSGQWSLGHVEGAGWNGSFHSTTSTGSTATFKFTGTQVIVKGTAPAGDTPAISSYSLDGHVTTFSSPTTDKDLYYVPYFEADALPYEPHTLVITYSGGNTYSLDCIDFAVPLANAAVPGSPYSTSKPTTTFLQPTLSQTTTLSQLDGGPTVLSKSDTVTRIQSFSPGTSSGTLISYTSTAGSSASASTTNAGSETSGDQASEASFSNASSSPQSASARTSTSVIAGSVAGALTIIAILVALLFICYKRRLKAKYKASRDVILGSTVSPYLTTPVTHFVVPSTASTVNGSMGSQIQASTLESYVRKAQSQPSQFSISDPETYQHTGDRKVPQMLESIHEPTDRYNRTSNGLATGMSDPPPAYPVQ